MYVRVEVCRDGGTIIHQLIIPNPQRGVKSQVDFGPDGIVETDGYVFLGYEFKPTGRFLLKA